jgi:pyridoxamine 5'-phosphate oxidase
MESAESHGPALICLYTNDQSRTGGELSSNPRAALLFHWKTLRVAGPHEGAVESRNDAEADAYFSTGIGIRQLGALASDQSRALDARRNHASGGSKDEATASEATTIPLPPHWG